MLHRRMILASAAIGLLATRARANGYPTDPIRIVVPTAAGAGSDIMARHLAERMRVALGVPVVVENRPGAAGNIGAEFVRHADPDGYTLMVTAAAFAIAPAVNRMLPFDVLRDFTPITLIASVPLFVVAKGDGPYRSLADVIAAARTEATVTFASFGNGSPPHLVGEVINQVAGVKMLHVPYRGASLAVPDLLGGRTTIGILDAVSTGPLVQSGALRALAITGPKRSNAFPAIPTLSEAGIPFDTVGWHAMFAPARLPLPIARRLNETVNAILAQPDMKSVIEIGGSVPIEPPTSLEDWRARFAADVAAWDKVARTARVQL